MSLLRATTQNNNNNANQNQNQQNGTPLRRLGQNSTNNNNNNANQNQQNNNPFRRPANNAPRFGSNQNQSNNRFRSNRFSSRPNVEWTVQPLHNIAVRFSLEGLGDPFHRLLDQPLNVEFGDPEKSIAAIQQDETLEAKLLEALDATWHSYQFEGAAMLYPWDTDVTRAFTTITQPVPEPEYTDDDDDDNNNPPAKTEPEKPPFECLRAIDAAFVLNILARTRSNVVVANTPLALEPAFLKQTFICDDPRVVAIARATGCVGDNWT